MHWCPDETAMFVTLCNEGLTFFRVWAWRIRLSLARLGRKS